MLQRIFSSVIYSSRYRNVPCIKEALLPVVYLTVRAPWLVPTWFCFLVSCDAASQRGPWPPHFWGFLITHNDAPQSVGLLWTSDLLVAETSTWQHITLTTNKHPCPLVRFEPIISGSERPQTYALDRAATGTGSPNMVPEGNICLSL